MEGGSSLMMSVPNIITSSPSGGRFDFDDGGTYCGGWQDGKAHGHGVCTGPKNVGEYSGSWNFGFEMSGVYKWTNGAVYEGRWQNGKRHGVGVEYNGKWIYKGEWSQGLKGRYGVKASSNSAVKYEGTWANGLQDGYGSETYSDGGYYQGQMCRGLRHGYGVRKSAPYGDSQLNNPGKNGPLVGGPAATSSMLLHTNSLQSAGSALDLSGAGGGGHLSAGNNSSNNNNDDDSPKPEDGFKPNIDRTLVSKNGFVLVAKPLDVPMPSSSSKLDSSSMSSSSIGGAHNSNSNNNSNLSMLGKRRNSFTNKLAQTAHRIPSQTTTGLLRGLRLKKQKSTSDMDMIGNSKASRSTNQQLGSSILNNDIIDQPIVPFTLSPEELDITDPSTVETYTGDWKHDKRNGHGVCDRSDGLKYEGQWHNDMKCGYGVTTFKDGTKEEGKYKNNILIVDSKVKRFFQLGSSNIRQRIDEAVKMAQQAQSMALKKAEIADTRAATARDKADQAMTAAYEADRDSQIAYSVARQYSDSQQQQIAMQQQQQQQQQHGYDIQMGPMGSLNMAASPLQLRRISQNQQRNNALFGAPSQPPFSQQSTFDQHQQLQQDQHPSLDQQDQQTGEKQFLGPIEPFNGRRGSFRGGSQQGSGGGGGGGAGLAGSFSSTANRAQMGASFAQQHHHVQSSLAQRQSSDPFSDLFDHYKSSSGVSSASVSAAFGVRARRGLSKQTSLDQAHLRASITRQTGSSASQYGDQTGAANEHSSRISSRFSRMSSSMDQADEHLASSRQADQSSMQQQFRHLVTSGEQLQQQQQQPVDNSDQQQPTTNDNLGPTPTNSSYLGAHSSASHQTPSPNESIGGPPTVSSYTTRPASSTGGQQQASGAAYTRQAAPTSSYNPSYASTMVAGHHQHPHQQADYSQQFHGHSNARDVHSLADEQLYLADRRRLHDELLGRTEYSNYDFTISNAPRPSQRVMRRTASLSRNTPLVRSRSQVQAGAHLHLDGTPTTGSQMDVVGDGLHRAAQWRRSQSPAPNANHLQQQHQTNPTFMMSDFGDQTTQVAHQAHQADHQHSNCNNSSHLMSPGDACSGSMGALNRKPSLQVRYDLLQLGGLMSREEVAALSHAQREQKRLEAELAERRAKRPLLHLYLSLKEFVVRHQLVFSVLFVNFWLFKMFFDLIM